MFVFIAALRRELAELERLLAAPVHSRQDGAVCTEGHVDGMAVALVQSGIGKERSIHATQIACARYRPALIIATGYSGGASPALKGGDLVIADRLIAEGDTQNGADSPPIAADAALVEASLGWLEEEFVPAHRGTIVSVPRAMPGAKQKTALSAHFQATAVDMESYWVAQAAHAAKTPALAVRAASDTSTDTLPDYERFLDPMGEVRMLSAAWYYATRPWHIPATPGLAANARLGARNIAAFAELLLARYPATAGVRR